MGEEAKKQAAANAQVAASEEAANALAEQAKATEEQKLSVVGKMEEAAKAQVANAKPTEEENKMVSDAIEYAETEPARQQQEDAKMTKQQLQEAVKYARQGRDRNHEVDDVIKDASDTDEGDAGEINDEEELNDLSQEGLVVD